MLVWYAIYRSPLFHQYSKDVLRNEIAQWWCIGYLLYLCRHVLIELGTHSPRLAGGNVQLEVPEK